MEPSNELTVAVVKHALETSKIRFGSISVCGRSIIARVRREGVELCVTVQLQPALAFAHTLQVTEGDDVSEMFGCLLRGILENDKARIRATFGLAH